MFKNAVAPMNVAKDGYDGMFDGKINVISGVKGFQSPMMKIAPIFPKKQMLVFVYEQQK